MRPTVDIGIDLGTTNSAVAVADNGRVEVVKNNDNQEITPSVVQLLANQTVIVGRKAYEQYRAHGAGDAHMGAKRQMGKQDVRYAYTAAGVERGPEELAAEVLKSLRADAETWLGEPVQSAVITVPAAFELAQCEATTRAAARAGIEQSALLQEPIAAGLAYGYERDLGDGFFIVYDLGGGTVDVTLLQIRDSRLVVVDHNGDNFLGGRDWDRRMSELIMDRLSAHGYEIWAIDDQAGAAFRRRLQTQAEEEKIRLSRAESVEVVFDGRLSDAEGRPIDTAITVARSEFEALITADIERSVRLAQALLDAQKLPASAVARVVPVGGPTLTPLLRRMLGDALGIRLDTRIDPMTVVARGAALFAASVPLRRPAAAVPGGDVLPLQLSYASVTDDDEAPVGGRIPVPAGTTLSIELRRADGGWASGRVPVSGDTFRARVILAPSRPNAFELSCFDEAGNRVAVSPDRIAITQGLAAAQPPLSQSISVVVLDERRREKLVRMLDKGAALPTVRQRSFRTSRELQPGDTGEVLRIHVVEGEHARADLNHHVGWLEITGEQIDRALPAGSPVDVKLRVDASRGVVASAYVSLLDLTIENVLQDTYRPAVDLGLIAADLSDELLRAREVAVDRTDDILRIEAQARAVEHDLRAAAGGDHDAADRASLGTKSIKAEVDRLGEETAGVRAAQALRGELESTQKIVDDYGDAEAQTRLALLEPDAERALGSNDPLRMQDVTEQLDALYWRVVTTDPRFWIDQFVWLADVIGQSERAGEYDVLLDSGREALQRQDMARLRTICNDLSRLLPAGEPVPDVFDRIGIIE